MSDLVGTYAQAAARLEVSEDLVRNLVKKGVLPHVRLGRRIVIPWHALDLWLASEAAKNVGEDPQANQ